MKNILQAYNNRRILIYLGLAFIFNYFVNSLNATFLPILELRKGTIVYDPILEMLPSVDISSIIFIFLYSIFFIGFAILAVKPIVFIQAIFTFACMYLIRFCCIWMLPLEPPAGLQPLNDPIVENLVLRSPFLTKDLFFSGHFACIFLLFLLFKNYYLKLFYLICSIILGLLVMLQHIHYSYDIIGAIPFCFLAFWIVSKLIVFIFPEEGEMDLQKQI